MANQAQIRPLPFGTGKGYGRFVYRAMPRAGASPRAIGYANSSAWSFHALSCKLNDARLAELYDAIVPGRRTMITSSRQSTIQRQPECLIGYGKGRLALGLSALGHTVTGLESACIPRASAARAGPRCKLEDPRYRIRTSGGRGTSKGAWLGRSARARALALKITI
jgi:hypothetical protein